MLWHLLRSNTQETEDGYVIKVDLEDIQHIFDSFYDDITAQDIANILGELGDPTNLECPCSVFWAASRIYHATEDMEVTLTITQH